MKKRIAEIIDCRYEVYGISCEPSYGEIAEAIEKGELEERGFQKDEELLNAEWNHGANSKEEYCALQKQYHARRIAYFVVHGWSDPVLLRPDGTVHEGTHRLRAAKHIGLATIDCSDASGVRT